ncbi:MAG TPA: nickel-dependent hydrogenase large subunit [Candidatus Aquicultor sp.]|jgi:Ni,Fe-hydrogenase I large subunit
MAKVVIDPVTRIEGHLRITAVVENGKVTDAWNTATLFRGFEIFMKGRDPRDSWHFAQRICGVCPTPHGTASAMAAEHAMGIEKVTDNARLVRNMMEAAQIAYDHILWFYILNAFDYVNVPNALNAKAATPALKAVQDRVMAVVKSGQLGPFANMFWDHPAYKLPAELDLELTAHYLSSIEIQQRANEATALMGGKFPMIMNNAAGGVTMLPRVEDIISYQTAMQDIQTFIDSVMLPDLLTIAPFYKDLATNGQGVGNYLSWGVLDEASQNPEDRLFPRGAIFDRKLALEKVDPDQVKMFTKSSFYADSQGAGKHPLDAGQELFQKDPALPPLEGKALPVKKYDWTQAARYGSDNRPMEVGPLAQVLVSYLAGRPEAKTLVDSTLKTLGVPGRVDLLMSNLGRIAARVIKAKINADNAVRWSNDLLNNVKAGKTDVFTDKAVPSTGTGVGAWDAPRGALSHYMRIANGKIGAYAAVPASNWNLSPRDDKGVRGPVEEALVGMPVVDPTKPLEILRVVHTFDP